MLRKPLLRQCRKFIADTAGGVSISLAATLLPLAVIVGGAVDYSRAMSVKTGLVFALDAAALAGANKLVREGGTITQVEKVVEDTFDIGVVIAENYGATLRSLDVTQDAQVGEVRVDATIGIKTTFMQLVGLDNIDISSKSVARLSDKDIELTMALDLTGSMSGSKIMDLKLAAKDLVDILLPTTGVKHKNKVRVGLVPYSQGVNAGPYANTATDGASSSCATERRGDQHFTDASYLVMPIGDGSKGCPSSQIFPLSESNSDLKTRINAFQTTGYTAGHTGIGWAWYMLSPEWSNLWPSSAKPAVYDTKETAKIAILMTDGQFNTAYDYKAWKGKYVENKGYAQSESEYRARKLCDNMKLKGIQIYTVAFQLSSSSAKNLMQYCASGSKRFYDASSGFELRESFRSIADEISQLRISE